VSGDAEINGSNLPLDSESKSDWDSESDWDPSSTRIGTRNHIPRKGKRAPKTTGPHSDRCLVPLSYTPLTTQHLAQDDSRAAIARRYPQLDSACQLAPPRSDQDVGVCADTEVLPGEDVGGSFFRPLNLSSCHPAILPSCHPAILPTSHSLIHSSSCPRLLPLTSSYTPLVLSCYHPLLLSLCSSVILPSSGSFRNSIPRFRVASCHWIDPADDPSTAHATRGYTNTSSHPTASSRPHPPTRFRNASTSLLRDGVTYWVSVRSLRMRHRLRHSHRAVMRLVRTESKGMSSAPARPRARVPAKVQVQVQVQVKERARTRRPRSIPRREGSTNDAGRGGSTRTR
jgi:hypothetical protein